MDEITYIPMLQLRPSGLLRYYDIIYPPRRSEKLRSSFISHPMYTGTMNPKAVAKLKRCITILCAISKWKRAPATKKSKEFSFKISFLTLTLPAPQLHITDTEIKSKIFDPFMKRMRRSVNLTHYVWRAEKQENGNIHFHIMSNSYIHHSRARTAWNECLNRFHFIDMFEIKHGHRDPNSIDIHSVRKVRSLAVYMAKYMTKLTQAQIPLDGKCWDASKSIKNAKFLNFTIDSDLENWYNKVSNLFPKQVRDDDFFQFIWLNEFQFNRVVQGKLKSDYVKWLDDILNNQIN
jgi:hypothetical protein